VCVCVLDFNHNLHSNCRTCIATAKARPSPVTDNALNVTRAKTEIKSSQIKIYRRYH